MIVSKKKRFFAADSRTCVSHQSVFQNAFFSQPKRDVPRCCFSLFGIFLFDRLGVQSGFSDNATGTSFPVFSRVPARRGRGSAGRRADEGGRASREAIFIVYRAPSVYYRKLDISRDER